MKKVLIVNLLAMASLAACVTADPQNYTSLRPESASERGTIVFFRGHSAQAMLANAFLGGEQGYFVYLDEDQYTSIEVPTGFHQLNVKTQGSVAYSADFKVTAGETVCIEAMPNYDELEWLVVPFVNALIPSFVLEERPCPNTSSLGEWVEI